MRVLVLRKAGDLTNALRQASLQPRRRCQREPWYSRVCSELIVNTRNGPASSRTGTSDRGEKTMKLYHFPNPQKVTFALLELGLDCKQIPVDLAKGEQREPEFLAVNPAGRVPVLVDDGVTLTESQAILAYLGDNSGRLWPASAAGRAQALQWLFFLSQHVMPAAGEVALRIRSRVTGVPANETVIASGEKALPA